MEAIQLEVCNATYGAPEGYEGEIQPLPVLVTRNPDKSVTLSSFWLPTPEELAALNEGKPIMLSILDTKHPPVKVEIANVELIYASDSERS